MTNDQLLSVIHSTDLPSECIGGAEDRALLAALGEFELRSDQEKEEASALLDRATAGLLRAWGIRMAVLAVREGNVELLVQGLVAISMACEESDREGEMDLLAAASVCRQLEVDPHRILQRAAALTHHRAASWLTHNLNVFTATPEMGEYVAVGAGETFNLEPARRPDPQAMIELIRQLGEDPKDVIAFYREAGMFEGADDPDGT